MIDYHVPDRFGVPESMFGAHDDDFYGAIGRIANLSALLEIRLIAIHQALGGLEQDEQTNLPGTSLCTNSKNLVDAALAAGTLTTSNGDRVRTFLNAAEVLLQARNGYVHNVWSAGSDQRVYGWRPGRHGKLTKDTRAAGIALLEGPQTWYTEDARQESIDVVLAKVRALVELHKTWSAAYAACQARQRPANP